VPVQRARLLVADLVKHLVETLPERNICFRPQGACEARMTGTPPAKKRPKLAQEWLKSSTALLWIEGRRVASAIRARVDTNEHVAQMIPHAGQQDQVEAACRDVAASRRSLAPARC
jgi:hypothetical protein